MPPDGTGLHPGRHLPRAPRAARSPGGIRPSRRPLRPQLRVDPWQRRRPRPRRNPLAHLPKGLIAKGLPGHGARMAGMEDRIAVIGLAGRFPGAKTVDALFSLLEEGRSGVTFFTDEELLRAGVSKAL